MTSEDLPPIPWDEERMGGSPLEYLMRAMSCDCSDGCATCAPHVYRPADAETGMPTATRPIPNDADGPSW